MGTELQPAHAPRDGEHDGGAPAPEPHEARRPAPPVSHRPPAADPLGGSYLDERLARDLARPRAGQALDEQVRAPMAEAMGANLDGVRVHTDSAADGLARQVQAVAFTHGQDVYFRRGAYRPDDDAGQRLLAHELAHVAHRHTEHADPGGVLIGRADDPAEAAADRVADRTMQALRRGGAGGP